MATTPDAVIDARVLGPARLTVNGAEAPSDLLWRKHLALLVYLARSPRRSRTREHLVGLLWSDRDEKQARHSLSEALRVCRRVLGDAAIVADVDQVRLAEGLVRLDCDLLAERCAREDWLRAAELAAGDFLEGLSVPDATAFEDWLLAERALWRGRSLEALVHGADALLARGDASGAAELAHRARALDPAAEPAARAAMRALALAGDRVGALRVADEVTRALAEQVGTAPSPETARLAERIRDVRVGRRLAAAPPSPAARPRPPLVGRGAELGRLIAAWERARAGEGQVVLVEGEPGQGKSRLIEELVARARLDQASVARSRAVPEDQMRSWSGLAGLLAAGLGDAPGLSGAPPGALAALGTLNAELATRFHAPSGSVPPPSPAWSDAARAVAAEAPLLLGLDDAQFLDAETAAALPALARDTTRSRVLLVLGVTTGTPARFDALRERLGRDLAGSVITLGGLDAVALAALVAWGVPSYDAAAAERLVRRLERDTAGIPLLAVSLVEAVSEGFRLSPESPSWPLPKRTLVDTLPGDLPPAVVGSVCARFARLPPARQQVLGAAAALAGAERVDVAVLSRACGLPAPEVTAALDALEWERWLTVDTKGYAFTALIERQILLQEMITPGQARRYRAGTG
jgi:DNA-binding SARP family transcriptional activator